jgi:hypothetical protein
VTWDCLGALHSGILATRIGPVIKQLAAWSQFRWFDFSEFNYRKACFVLRGNLR